MICVFSASILRGSAKLAHVKPASINQLNADLLRNPNKVSLCLDDQSAPVGNPAQARAVTYACARSNVNQGWYSGKHELGGIRIMSRNKAGMALDIAGTQVMTRPMIWPVGASNTYQYFDIIPLTPIAGKAGTIPGSGAEVPVCASLIRP